MFNKDMPDQVFSNPTDSNNPQILGMRIAPQQSSKSIPPTHQQPGDYSLFLRSFDSNQRLSRENNQMIQHQVNNYRSTYSNNPMERNQPVMPTQFNFNNPYASGFDRQGAQTRYSGKKERNSANLAHKQLETSYTPQQIQYLQQQQILQPQMHPFQAPPKRKKKKKMNKHHKNHNASHN